MMPTCPNVLRYGRDSKNKGEAVCANRKTIKREILEDYVLSALKAHLMQEELVEVFCAEYTKHLNMLNNQKNAAQRQLRAKLDSLKKERVNLTQTIQDRITASMVKDDLTHVSEHQEEAKALLNA